MWFPSSSAWWSAFRLSIPMFGLGAAVGLFIFWTHCLIGVGLIIADPNSLLFVGGTTALFLGLAIVWYGFLVVIYSIVLKLLWRKPPQWLSPNRSLRVQIYNFWISAISLLPVVALYAIYIGGKVNGVFDDIRLNLRDPSHPAIVIAFFIWLITTAYLIHWAMLLKSRRNLTGQR